MTSSTFAADTLISSVYQDINGDGTIDTALWTFDENITACNFEPGDWIYNRFGDFGSFHITDLSCLGPNLTIDIAGAAAGVTGSASDPTIGYRQNNGTANSIVLNSGNLTDKLLVNLTDNAAPRITSDGDFLATNYSTNRGENGVLVDDAINSTEAVTYSLSGADGALFVVGDNAPDKTLSFVTAPDFENPAGHGSTQNHYLMTMIVDDGNGNQGYVDFTIHVNDINAAPTDIALDSNSVDENLPAGTVVGNLSNTDDGEDNVGGNPPTYTYTLVTGTGDTDNDSFTIDGTELKTASSFDYETKNSYSIRVNVNDGKTGNDFAKSFTINVNDINETTARPGKSGKRSSGASKIEYTCKDSKAINFSSTGTHKQSLCVYEKKMVKKEGGKIEKSKNESAQEKKFLALKGKIIKLGSRGSYVKELQKYLNENGFGAGKEDGIAGKMTIQAVKKLQKKFGLRADGIVGPQTMALLRKACESEDAKDVLSIVNNSNLTIEEKINALRKMVENLLKQLKS